MGAAAPILDQKVQLRLVAEDSKDDVGGEAGIPGIEGCGEVQEQV